MIGDVRPALLVSHAQVFRVVVHAHAVDLQRRGMADEDIVVKVGEFAVGCGQRAGACDHQWSGGGIERLPGR
ncbi:hypothetical protein D3C77_705620 [compost metagenome]